MPNSLKKISPQINTAVDDFRLQAVPMGGTGVPRLEFIVGPVRSAVTLQRAHRRLISVCHPQVGSQKLSCRTSNKIPSAGHCRICSIDLGLLALVSANPVRQFRKVLGNRQAYREKFNEIREMKSSDASGFALTRRL
jgi:hypothetical protein